MDLDLDDIFGLPKAREKACPICNSMCELHPELRKQSALTDEFMTELETMRNKYAKLGLHSFLITASVILPIDHDAEHLRSSNGYIANVPNEDAWRHLERHQHLQRKAQLRITRPTEKSVSQPSVGDSDFEVF